MTNTIKLPPLPSYMSQHDDECSLVSPAELRARGIEVARAVLEAAAKVCWEWGNQSLVETNRQASYICAANIRALKIEGEA